MTSIMDSRLLTELKLPGTHGSAASYTLSNKNVLVPDPTAGGYLGITQTLTIDEQLQIGVRFLDVRIAGDYCGRSDVGQDLHIDQFVANQYCGRSDVGKICTNDQFVANQCLPSRYMLAHGTPPVVEN